jgi:hypothetical protein
VKVNVFLQDKYELKFSNLTLNFTPFKILDYDFYLSYKYVYHLGSREFLYNFKNEKMFISIPLREKIKILSQITDRIQIVPDAQNIDHVYLEIIDKENKKYEIFVESDGFFVIYRGKKILSIESKNITLFSLIDIVTKIVENNFYFDKVVNELQEIKNSLSTYIENEKWENNNINSLNFSFDIKVGNIEFRDEILNFGLYYDLGIDNIEKKTFFETGVFSNNIYFSTNSEYFPKTIDYFTDLLQNMDISKMFIFPNQVSGTNIVYYNEKEFMIFCEKNIYIAISDESIKKTILFIGFNKISDLLNRIKLIKEFIKNKDTIFNLTNKQKYFALNYANKVFKNMIKKLNILRNKLK